MSMKHSYAYNSALVVLASHVGQSEGQTHAFSLLMYGEKL